MQNMDEGLRSIDRVLSDADNLLKQGRSASAYVWPTGFGMLDTYLNGGFRAGELVLLGGPQGLGKTTWAWQAARNIAHAGHDVIYFSFEHDNSTMLERLIALEAGEALGVEAVGVKRVRAAMEASEGSGSLAERLADAPGGSEALEAVRGYASRLHVYPASGTDTTLDTVRQVIRELAEAAAEPPVVIVDYLQKIPLAKDVWDEAERVTRIVEGLKDVALQYHLPVVAIVAADKEGLDAGKRVRVGHLRGSSALAYEADVVLLLNDKYNVVARHHLVYDVGNAERYRNYAVLSIEKNRTGLDRIDLEYRKRFEQSRFEPDGIPVAEQLVDERVFVD